MTVVCWRWGIALEHYAREFNNDLVVENAIRLSQCFRPYPADAHARGSAD